MITEKEFEYLCSSSYCFGCIFQEDCLKVRNVEKDGNGKLEKYWASLTYHGKYTKLVRYWRKQKLSKLLS